MWMKRLPNELWSIIVTIICHNLTPVDQKARKKKKRMCIFEKTTDGHDNVFF